MRVCFYALSWGGRIVQHPACKRRKGRKEGNDSACAVHLLACCVGCGRSEMGLEIRFRVR